MFLQIQRLAFIGYSLLVVSWLFHLTDGCVSSRMKKVVKLPYDRNRMEGTRKGRCIDLTGRINETVLGPSCQHLGYNSTYFPNVIGQIKIRKAAIEAGVFHPLIEVMCSDYSAPFLCSVFFPKCSPTGKTAMLPCRSLCRAVQVGCEPLLNNYGFMWPNPLKCDLFPMTDCYDAGLQTSPTLTSTTPHTSFAAITDPSSESEEKSSTRGVVSTEKEEQGSTIGDTSTETGTTVTTDISNIVDNREDEDRPRDCVKGSYACRHATSKVFVNGDEMCCFDKRQVSLTNMCRCGEGGEKQQDTSDCQCLYPKPVGLQVPKSC